MQRLPGIHGLRAVAAMGIVLIHIVGVTQFVVALPVIDKIIPLCMLSVPLFFVVSAFSLAYAHDGSVGRDGWIWPYIIKRLFRIAPLFYVMLLVWRWAGWPPQTPALLLLNVTFLFGFVPGQHESLVWAGWSVGVEMPFYVAFPFILERVRRLSHGFALLAVAAAISVVARIWIASLPSLPAPYSYMSIPSNVAFFAAGLLPHPLDCFRAPRCNG